MPTNVDRRVTLGVFGNISDLKAKLGWVSSQKRKLESEGVDVPIDADTKPAEISMDDLRRKFQALADKRVSVKIDTNDKAAVASIAAIEHRLAVLDRTTSRPKIGLTGATKALADIALIDRELDKLDRKSGGGGGGFFSRIGGMLGGGGGAAGGAGPAAGGGASGITGALSNPYVAGTAAAVGAVAAPFAGQALGGSLIFGLGTALAGLGVLAASKLKPVQDSFDGLKTRANRDLTLIGAPFAPVMVNIINTARGAMNKLTPILTGAMRTLAGPVKQFGDALINAFSSPAIAGMINAIAKAFGAILKNLAPSLPGMINEIANAITAIANNIAKNPGAFNFFIHFLITSVQWALNVVNALIVAGNWIEAHFNPAIRSIAYVFLGMGIQVLQAVKALVDGVLSAFGTILHGAATAFGWVPGLGGKLKEASKAFDNFKSGVDTNLDNMINNMHRWQNDLMGSGKTSQSVASQIVDHFNRQSAAAHAAAGMVNTYSGAIKNNGVNSSQASAARVKLVNDMISAGVNARTANTDVGRYTDAVRKNGINSDQARAARQRLSADIQDAFDKSVKGKNDMQNYTHAVMVNGSNSDQARSARQRLLTDLKNAGVNAKDAKSMVDKLQGSINALKSKTINVIMNGQGSFKVTEVGGQYAFSSTSKSGQVTAYKVKAAASGLYINSGTPGVDDQLILAQRDELVVPPKIVRSGAVDHLRGMIPGFAGGGVVGNLGPGSVPGMYRDFRNQMVGAMESAMKAAMQAASSAAMSASPVGNVGSGVARWTGVVEQALRMLGLSLGLTSRVLFQMQTESGGNPNAQNNWDVNAMRGDPSRGLLQTIMSTFRAYHVAGTSGNIFDPLANVAAAINYAAHVYGPSLMRGGMGMGSGHGYRDGTRSARRGWAWVGEGGVPELIHFSGGEQVGPVVGGGGRTYIINVYVQGHALASKQEIGRTVADALRIFKQKGGSV